MKSLVISILIVVILITTWLLMYDTISQSTKEFNSLINKMENEVLDNKWTSTMSIYHSIDDKWEEKQSTLLLILDHEEIEKINLSLRKVKKYIIVEDKTMTLGETSVLKFLLNHIQEKESLSLKNIF